MAAKAKEVRDRVVKVGVVKVGVGKADTDKAGRAVKDKDSNKPTVRPQARGRARAAPAQSVAARKAERLLHVQPLLLLLLYGKAGG